MLYSLGKAWAYEVFGGRWHDHKEDVMAELRDVTFGNCVSIRKTVHRFSRDFNAMCGGEACD